MRQKEFPACRRQCFDFHAVPERIAIEQDTQHDHLVGIVQCGDLKYFQPVAECCEYPGFLGGQVGFSGDEFKPCTVPGSDRRWQIAMIVELGHCGPALQVIAHAAVSVNGNGATGGHQFPENIFCLHFKIHEAALGKIGIASIENLFEPPPVAGLTP